MRHARLRRPLAALFAAAAAGLALLALRPGPPPSVRVLAAARDLPAGTTLTASDVRPVALPPSAVPSGALRTAATGRTLAGPMRQGEPLTDARVLGDALLHGYGPGTVAAPVRITDPDAVRLLHPGDHIDVLTHPPPESPTPAEQPPDARWSTAKTVVSDVPVITAPPPTETAEGALVVLATSRPQALALATAGPYLSLTITSP
ncbi:flagellar biosynthesis protein FlgA [Actinomadura sp. NAK00032]|uniref:SAF domain-containing protein n=1 Tax=Actinomadura sp. NAK00032 TaxID=2742128 RepID=UPI00158FF1D7|nr:SAF domain-containing protein [Actinomadura sp. NAK00032]QKW33939.1 flagellar biosynthesis protein FlgA [Actinomadura sp. NAK00032]